MNTVEVCLSPELISQYSLSGKIVVVVDILRATSCFTAGIASGVAEIRPFADVEECRKYKDKGYLLAGERGGEKIEGFDIGNSPFDYMKDSMKGKKVAVTTTNGTRAIHLSQKADEIVMGSFLNLTAVRNYLMQTERELLIFCAGWKGKINLEDSLFAGALINELSATYTPKDDASIICQSSYDAVSDTLPEIIAKSEHAQRLSGFDMSQDISFCSQRNFFNTVPVVKNGCIVSAF